MPARRILQLGDPILRRVSAPVDFAGGAPAPEARLALRDLRATLHAFQRTWGFGRGISAVQIGEPLRLIYIEFEGTPYCLFNPRFERMSQETFRLWDDCFSFPNLMVELDRSRQVELSYTGESGEPRRLLAQGALSELLQHELDHLDGILAVDRARDRFSFATREEYLRRLRRG